jgi:hypothetical protein
MGKPAALVAGLGIGAGLILWNDKPPHPAAAPKPVTRTIYVHQTVTKVIQATGHTGLPPWAVVVSAVVAFGSLCGLAWRRST